MAKPVVKSFNEIVVNLEWLREVVEMVDRKSYSCGGLCTCVNGQDAMNKLTSKILTMDVDELKKEAR
ncbi:MAG: hypothetical protein WCK59_04190 [Candidatus Falkowbacteria bacterium]